MKKYNHNKREKIIFFLNIAFEVMDKKLGKMKL